MELDDLRIFLQIVREYYRYGYADRATKAGHTIRQIYTAFLKDSGYKLIQVGVEFHGHRDLECVASSAEGKQIFRPFRNYSATPLSADPTSSTTP